MKALKSLILILSVSLAPSLVMLSKAYAGGANGGGGGAYVCRDSSGKITNAELLDLFEAREVSGRTIVYDESKSIETQVEEALAKVTLIHSQLGGEALAVWKYIQTHQSPRGRSGSLDIDPPDDANSNLKKKVNGVSCPLEGMMFYDDIRDRLVMKWETFDAQQSKTEKAASYVHESIYKAMRTLFSQQNSGMARMMTGCLFTDDYVNCMNLVPVQIPPKAIVYTCKVGNSSALVYKTRDLSDQDSEWKIFFKSIRGLNFGFETSVLAQGRKNEKPGDGGFYLYFFDDEVRIKGLGAISINIPYERAVNETESLFGYSEYKQSQSVYMLKAYGSACKRTR